MQGAEGHLANLQNKRSRDVKKTRVTMKITKTLLRKVISKKNTTSFSFKGSQSRYFKRVRNGGLRGLVNQTQLQCPICLEVMISPTLQICGHACCLKCLMANEAHRKSCCICRQGEESDPYLPSLFVETLINKFVLPNYNHNDLIKYLCRSSDSAEWLKRRRLGNVREGIIIDFCDGLNVWRKAMITSVFGGDNEESMVEVKFIVKGEEFREKVEAESNRLAPYAFFTKGRYLLNFLPSLPLPEIAEFPLQRLLPKQVPQQDQFFREEAVPSSSLEVEEVEQYNPEGSLLDQALDMLNYNNHFVQQTLI